MATAVVFFNYVIFLLFIIEYGGESQKVAQERARVIYYDPKHVKNPQAFTFRSRRGDVYRSNFTATIMHAWGNNLVVSSLGKGAVNDTLVRGRLCDVFKMKWLAAYISKYMFIKPICPVPAGLYGLYNIELPPKDFPLPLPKGETALVVSFVFEGKKKMLQTEVKLKVA